MLGDFETDLIGRSSWRDMQRHVGFFGSAITLFDIAGQARCYYVVPGIGASSRARDDVIDGQIVTIGAAILA